MPDSATLMELIKGGETSRVELKIAAPRPVDVAQRLCGMANGQGGYFILGVEDKTLELVGVKNVGETIDTVLQGARLCKPPVLLEGGEPQTFDYKGKQIVVAVVPANNGSLYQASGVFWVRRGSHTIPMEVGEVEQHLYSQGITSWELRPVYEAGLEDLNLEVVREWLAARPASSRLGGRLNNLEEILLNLNCAVRVNPDRLPASASHSGDLLRPTNAGILLFGNFPQRWIIQSEVTCVLYNENLGSRRYTDRRVITGTIPELIEGAEAFFTRHMPVAARIEGFRRIDEPEYPPEVLREAIVNAIVHRDYSLGGESVRIFYYPDRIEIRNPGLLLPGLTIEDLAEGRARSRLRNPIIASILRDLPGSYMERMGSGVRFMIDRMQELGYSLPVFREVGEFILTFHKKEEAIPTPPPLVESSVTEARYRQLLEYLHKYGKITNKEYRALTGVSETTALRDLEALLERGTIRPVGKGRNRHYVL
jgi:ATP-dependent DNA helicase RecG